MVSFAAFFAVFDGACPGCRRCRDIAVVFRQHFMEMFPLQPVGSGGRVGQVHFRVGVLCGQRGEYFVGAVTGALGGYSDGRHEKQQVVRNCLVGRG